MISQFNDWINLSGGPLINPAFVGSVNYSVSPLVSHSFGQLASQVVDQSIGMVSRP